MDLLEPGGEGESSPNKGPKRRWSLRVGDAVRIKDYLAFFNERKDRLPGE
jgi:hypothetical protein